MTTPTSDYQHDLAHEPDAFASPVHLFYLKIVAVDLDYNSEKLLESVSVNLDDLRYTLMEWLLDNLERMGLGYVCASRFTTDLIEQAIREKGLLYLYFSGYKQSVRVGMSDRPITDQELVGG